MLGNNNEKNQKNLPDEIEYIIIENEKTKEIIAKITQEECEAIIPYVIRIKYK